MRDLAQFVDERDGNSAVIRDALEMVLAGGTFGNLQALADILSHSINSGEVTVVGEEQKSRQNVLIEVPGESGVYLHRSVLENRLEEAAIDSPDPKHITKVLSMEGVLVERDANGWLLDAEWVRQLRQSSMTELTSAPPAMA